MALRSVEFRLLAVATIVVGLLVPVRAASLRAGFTETTIVSGLSSPTAMAFAPDGRIFVCLQGGQLRVIESGQLLATPFVSLVVNSTGERGLLGVAFDPAFSSNQYVYVYYTATTPTIHNRVSRFTANGNLAVPGSETVILELNPLTSATNHNGGAIHFAPDGTLFVAVGDNANGANSQTLDNLLGKMLRINADGTVPTTNPFYSAATGINRAIWALGLRNPFTFAIHPISSRLLINDVGQNAFEEIDVGAAGANYGWPTTEGYTTNPSFTSPLYAYSHGSGPFQGCAITGGAIYAGLPQQFPAEYLGDYFFADYCTGWINQLDETSGVTVSTFASGISQPVDLQVGPDGSLYYLARGGGVLRRISYTGSQAPTITTEPSDLTVSVGQPATFTVGASGTPPIAYQWYRNGGPINGATSDSYTLASAGASDSGALFRAVVSNAGGSATSRDARLTVVANTPPQPTILTPSAGTLYTAGTDLAFSGSATDAEDGTVPAARFAWTVVFHHDQHTHPGANFSGVTSGSFAIPAEGHTETNVWYRITLTVTDSQGMSATVSRDVLPRVVQMTLASNPTGIPLTLDGQPVTAPYTFGSVVGVRRAVGAPATVTIGSTTYDFRAWSDRGAQTHVVTTPSTNTTLTASYRKRGGPKK